MPNSVFEEWVFCSILQRLEEVSLLPCDGRDLGRMS